MVPSNLGIPVSNYLALKSFIKDKISNTIVQLIWLFHFHICTFLDI